jgi:hypothetical protein
MTILLKLGTDAHTRRTPHVCLGYYNRTLQNGWLRPACSQSSLNKVMLSSLVVACVLWTGVLYSVSLVAVFMYLLSMSLWFHYWKGLSAEALFHVSEGRKAVRYHRKKKMCARRRSFIQAGVTDCWASVQCEWFSSVLSKASLNKKHKRNKVMYWLVDKNAVTKGS